MEIPTHYFVWRRPIHTECPVTIMRKVSALGQVLSLFFNWYLSQKNTESSEGKLQPCQCVFLALSSEPKEKMKAYKLAAFLKTLTVLSRKNFY